MAYSHDKSILQSVFLSALQLKLDILYTVHFQMQLIKEFHVSHHMHVANILWLKKNPQIFNLIVHVCI